MSGTVWIGLCILLGAIALEVFAPTKVREGFLAITGSGRSDDPPRQNGEDEKDSEETVKDEKNTMLDDSNPHCRFKTSFGVVRNRIPNTSLIG